MKFFLNGHIKKILKKKKKISSFFETKATLGLHLNHTACFSFVIKWEKKAVTFLFNSNKTYKYMELNHT